MIHKYIKATVFFSMICIATMAQKKVEFEAPGVYPEGVAYDASANVFYVSGARTATIGKVNMAGNYTTVFEDSTLKSTYGMKIDPAQKKLWVCAGDPMHSKYKSDATYRKMIRLIGIDLATGRKTNDVDLSNIAIGNHFANDLTMDDKGNIFITDSYSPNIYKVDAAGKASVFSNSAMFYAAGIGLNGIVYHPGGYFLTVNSGNGALLKVSMTDPKDVMKVKIDQFFPGADGLVLDNNNTLSLVQNQSVNKVFKLMSTDNWQTAKVTMATKSDALFAQPSTAVMVGQNIWALNSKLNELADSMHAPSKKFSIQQAEFASAQ